MLLHSPLLTRSTITKWIFNIPKVFYTWTTDLHIYIQNYSTISRFYFLHNNTIYVPLTICFVNTQGFHFNYLIAFYYIKHTSLPSWWTFWMFPIFFLLKICFDEIIVCLLFDKWESGHETVTSIFNITKNHQIPLHSCCTDYIPMRSLRKGLSYFTTMCEVPWSWNKSPLSSTSFINTSQCQRFWQRVSHNYTCFYWDSAWFISDFRFLFYEFPILSPCPFSKTLLIVCTIIVFSQFVAFRFTYCVFGWSKKF